MYPAKRASLLLPPATVLARAPRAFELPSLSGFRTFRASASRAMASPKASSPQLAEDSHVIELLKQNSKVLEQMSKLLEKQNEAIEVHNKTL
eukprot:6510192-Pyramimonas_sp.AAC.1